MYLASTRSYGRSVVVVLSSMCRGGSSGRLWMGPCSVLLFVEASRNSRRWALRAERAEARRAAATGPERRAPERRKCRRAAPRYPLASVCARPPPCSLVSVTPCCDIFDSCYRESCDVFVSELWCIPMKMWSDFQVSDRS